MKIGVGTKNPTTSVLGNQKIRLDDWEFEFQQRDGNPVIMADLWCRSFSHSFSAEIRLPVRISNYLFTASGRGYIQKRQKTKIISAFKKAIRREQYLEYLVTATKQRVRELAAVTTRITGRISRTNATDQDIADWWEEFEAVFTNVIPWFFIPWYITEYNLLTDTVRRGLKRHRTAVETITDSDNALILLTYPTKHILLQKEQQNFYNLVAFAMRRRGFKKNRIFLKLAQEHIKKYGWTKTFLLVPVEPLSMRELTQRVDEAIAMGGLNAYRLQRREQARDKRMAARLLKAVQKDTILVRNITWAREFGWLLTWSVEQALVSTSELIPFFKLIAHRLGASYPQWALLTHKEMVQRLQDGKIVSQHELKKRSVAYAYLMQNGRMTMIMGTKARATSRAIDSGVGAVPKDVSIITGQTASQGHAQGKARIIMLARDAHKLKNGEVLVCSMTSPDYVPAMKRAAAIITDEGGLLCHAAIVSRELGKPCIIGTKIATQVLKDGVMVEVDAKKGIVRIK